MIKNTAGQYIGFQAISTTDGSDVTAGSPTVYYTIDGGTQSTTSSSAVHEGNGNWVVPLAQGETNGDHIAYTFVLSGAVTQTVNVYTTVLADFKADVTGLSTFDSTTDTVDVGKINGNSNAAIRLALSAAQIIPGTISDAVLSPSTTAFAADDITEATADHYNGRVIIFTSGSLLGQATSITDYSLVSSEGNFTVVAMTEAPANNDTFIII